MTVISPKNRYELEAAFDFAHEYDGPIAVRYPRGIASDAWKECQEKIVYGKSEVLEKGKEIAILAVGNMVEEAEIACQHLKENGLQPTLVNARFVKPFDSDLVDELAGTHKIICTVEENVYQGGYGQTVLSYIAKCGYGVTCAGCN